MSVSREKYWEELSPEEKMEKLAQAVELLGRWFNESDKINSLLNQHMHGIDGKIVVPLQHNEAEHPWYRSHLLNRKPKGDN